MRRADSNSLIGQILAVNVLLVTATVFAASAAAGLNLAVQNQRWQFALLAASIVLVLGVNILMLRRRFSPLEQLIEDIEAIDPAQPAAFEAPEPEDATEEIDRLSASFRRLLSRIEAEQRRSGRLVLRAQEEERRRLARDLHDEVNQALTAILLRLEALRQDAPEALGGQLEEVRQLVNQAMEELLKLARQLRPSALDDHGLVPAIEGQVRRFAQQTGVKASLETRGQPALLGPDQQIAVYRVAQEALSNVGQHADASSVNVELETSDDGVALTVRDDGRGFDPADRRNGGLGLGGMAERARLVGGDLAIESQPGQGTALTLRIP
jgi:two-component system, NarL family, sensor histidine kinase UhpB